MTTRAEGLQLLCLVLFNFLPPLSCTVVGLPRLVCFIKENFNPAVSVHLVHTVKCLLVVGFFSSFLILWFFFSPLFLFPSQPQAEAAGYNASAQLWQSSSIVKRRKSPHFH